jgi:molybdenum cofactor cytidylyltransferase
MDDWSDLSRALGLRAGDVVSVVGAGGKTTTIYRLGAELVRRGLTTASTTTTAIQCPSPGQSPLLLIEEETPDLDAAVAEGLRAHGHVTVVRRARRADKCEGVSGTTVERLARLADVVVVEADGARHAALKAPAAHEPVVPPATSVFLSVAGLHALGRPLADVCHRPEIAATLAGRRVDEPASVETIARLLGSPLGGLKGQPAGARAWAVLTHARAANLDAAREIARGLRGSGYTGVLALSPDSVLRIA